MDSRRIYFYEIQTIPKIYFCIFLNKDDYRNNSCALNVHYNYFFNQVQ